MLGHPFRLLHIIPTNTQSPLVNLNYLYCNHSHYRYYRSMDEVLKSYLSNEQTVYLSQGHYDNHRQKRQVRQKFNQKD